MKLEKHDEVVEIKKVVTQPEEYVLTLDRFEAEALAVVCSLIAGDPKNSARSVFDGILRAFRENGLNYTDADWAMQGSSSNYFIKVADNRKVSGNITFHPGTAKPLSNS